MVLGALFVLRGVWGWARLVTYLNYSWLYRCCLAYKNERVVSYGASCGVKYGYHWIQLAVA